ncbi:hypothetical protein GIB67_002114 [Kingdonia uniflora]|uniref:Uncharacterized protein n=1 Tax=Kingdonia uniflora TaxID=39325 RepID=A0A7J7KWH1_9MAGN|nr:hypothetical protein GIB67_002114 [Kingdonia uniflora]
MRLHGTFTTVFKVWKDIATLLAVRDAVYWFYEYCGVGHPIVKEEVKYPSYPRLRAWERGNRRKTNDQAANLFIIGRYHIDHRTVETITWELWFDSAVSKTEDVLNAKLLSHKRIPLQVPSENCEYYLGDRCWRKVIGEVCIPLDPPYSMSPYISPEPLHKMRQARFDEVEQFVVGEDLQLRRGSDVWVLPLPLGGGARMRQRGSGPRTREGSTSRKGQGTGDDSE